MSPLSSRALASDRVGIAQATLVGRRTVTEFKGRLMHMFAGLAMLALAAGACAQSPKGGVGEKREPEGEYRLLLAARDLCSIIPAAQATIRSLSAELSDQQEQAFRDDTPQAWSALESRIQALNSAMPGMHFQLGAETVYGHVDFLALASIAGDPREGALLTAMERLVGAGNGLPHFVEQRTDISVCLVPEAFVATLHELSMHWTDAPVCLREALQATVETVVREGAGNTCFCDGTAREAAPLLARLKKLDLPGSEQLAQSFSAATIAGKLESRCSAGF